ncbi:unnamed protein product [Haemonchus placei]|uniref:Ovule protein n=1 Tax=Haemonchus placei TaxID=6290 RepID=A0A0N4X032_HAEPC|nr:unnamed protein product [Haemonchus placei]
MCIHTFEESSAGKRKCIKFFGETLVNIYMCSIKSIKAKCQLKHEKSMGLWLPCKSILTVLLDFARLSFLKILL